MAEAEGLTRSLGRFVAGLDPDNLPERACAIAATGFVDCVAVMIAGWDAPAARHLRGAARAGDWTDPLAPSPLRPEDDALHLAVAAHALDFDDTAIAGHPSAVLVPAILAELRDRPARGIDAVAAWIAGYEVWAEMDAREDDPLHGKGWHPSAVYGPPAAAAAISKLRGFDADRTAAAISIASSMSGGVIAQFGTWTKPYQLARAAQAGHVAAALAAAGMEAAPNALEHPLGLLAALSPNGRVRLDGPRAEGLHVVRQGLNVKFYPVCYAMHRALDATAAVARAHAIDPETVAEFNVEIGATQAGILVHPRPETVAQARFSLQFGIAAALLRGKCGLAELELDFVRSADVRAILPLEHDIPLQERSIEEPAHSPWDRVTFRLADGRSFSSGEIAYPAGHFRNPASPAALRAKFDDCVSTRIPAEAADALHAALAGLPSLETTAHLFDQKELADVL